MFYFIFLCIILSIFYFILYFLFSFFMQEVMQLKHLVTKVKHQSKRDRNSPAWAMWRTATTVKATQIFIFQHCWFGPEFKGTSPATQNTKITQLLKWNFPFFLKLKHIISVPPNIIAKITIVFIFLPLVSQTDVQNEFTLSRQIDQQMPCSLMAVPMHTEL